MNDNLASDSAPSGGTTVTDSLVERYVACECSELEKMEVERWIGDDPKERAGLKSMRQHVIHCRKLTDSYATNARGIADIMYEVRVNGRDNQSDEIFGTRKSTDVGIRNNRPIPYVWSHSIRAWLIGISAMAVVALLSTMLLPGSSSGSSVSYIARPGQTAHILLVDGSDVVLNAGSALEMGSAFHKKNRNVALSGEAVFNVPAKANTPFVVDAGSNKIKVLGTSFVISNYLDDSVVKVAVRSGRVSVDDIVIDRHKKALVSRGLAPVISLSSEREFSFESGLLIIEDTPLGEAIERLNRWYDVQIVLASPYLSKMRIDGGFRMENPEYLVWILEQTLNVSVRKSGKFLIVEERVNLR